MNENDKIDEMINEVDKLIESKNQLIEKLTENIVKQHKRLLNYKNKLFELCELYGLQLICPFNINGQKKINQDCKIKNCKHKKGKNKYKFILTCWKVWVNE